MRDTLAVREKSVCITQQPEECVRRGEVSEKVLKGT